MEADDVPKLLAALAHPVRLNIYRALVTIGQQGMTPGVMQDALGVPPTTLSFHLKELAAAGLVTHERAGRNLVYHAAYESMNSLMSYLTANCCQGAPCPPSTPAQCDC